MTALERAREYFDRIDASPGPSDTVNLTATVGALLNAMEEMTAPAVSRVDALSVAREHVEAMATNACGYQDGVKLSDKAQAIDAFARFLLGE
ncbi:hypothetical protein [Streptomyces umbrinus]|uniref:hypothetical protein n=1 Tax=Streptomyces umbrinus TaxID=67370 RepID=UPI00341420B9